MQIVYYSGWSIYSKIFLENIDLTQTDCIIYAFLKPTPDSTLTFHDRDADIKNLETLRSLKNEYPNLRTLVSVGGWTFRDEFRQAIYNDPLKFAKNIHSFVIQFGLNGVDLDWEYPDGEEDSHILSYVVELLGKNMEVSLALRAIPTISEFYLRKMEPYVDYFNIMTYDFVIPTSSLHAELPVKQHQVIDSIETYLTFLPSYKINLGINVYKTVYMNTKLGGNNLGANVTESDQSGECGYGSHVMGLHVRQVPAHDKEPHRVNQPGYIEIYECPVTVNLKRQIAQRMMLNGVFFWDFKGAPDLINKH